MRGAGILALAAAFALAGAAPAACAGAPAGAKITVYTWTDAAGVTHFSDKPRASGPAKKLLLPTPPPPDQTALAAQRAWVRELDRDWRASQERAAAQRRLETELAARAAERGQYAPQQTQYVPLYAPYAGRRGYHHRRRGDHDRDDRRGPPEQELPDARFPQNALPSSFPDPLASSFPGLPSSSFPEARGGSLAPPPPH